MEYQSVELENGLKVVHKYINSHVAYCGFIVNVGTRDEKTDEYGMAHFVEHMLFKGTKKRKSHHIINRMETVGGEINAYTNKEETVIYSVFLDEHYSRAIELLSDLTFNSTFPQKEIDKEVDVIIDEIHSYEDSPSELIFDEFEDYMFRNSELGHNILGEEELLKTFTTDKTKQFVDRFYFPSNMVFFYSGKTELKKIVNLLKRETPATNKQHTIIKRSVPSDIITTNNFIPKNTSQAHALIGSRSYDLYNPKRKTLQLINNILGGPGMNSRLNVALREKKGYVYNVESNLITYTDCGLFTIYFGSENKNRYKCVEVIYKELKKLREKKLSTLQLTSAKRQLIGQIGISSGNYENVTLSLAKSYLRYNHFDSISEISGKIERISSGNILEVANEILSEDNLIEFIYEQSSISR